MEVFKKKSSIRIRDLLAKISDDNLFLLSSSISYYSALAIAPFLLIILGVAALLGQNIQIELTTQAQTMSPQLGAIVKMLFKNVNEGINLSSISGVIGVIFILSTASLVFLQIRYAFDVIYGHLDPNLRKTFWETIKEKLFAMLVVLIAGLFFIISVSLTAVVGFQFGPWIGRSLIYRYLVFFVNFLIYTGMFTGIHFFAPSKRPKLRDALRVSLLTATFFILGNITLAYYLKRIALENIYGATGSLLVFLIWSYYSSFMMFLSVEVFLHFKNIRKEKRV